MRHEIIVITPYKAQQMLKNNTDNPRILRNLHVDSLSKTMLLGFWKEEHNDDICITKSGKVANGQHRLHAIVKSGVTLNMSVKYDMSEDCGLHMDKGLLRSSADTARQMGILNATWIISGIKYYLALKKGIHASSASISSMGIVEDEIFQEYYCRESFWIDAQKKSVSYYNSLNRYLPPSFIMGYMVVFSEIDASSSILFFDKLCNQTGYTDKDPIKLLRQFLEKDNAEKHKNKFTTLYKSALFIKAWNAFRGGKQLSIIKWDKSRDVFPTPI
jgi:hypothetical protein